MISDSYLMAGDCLSVGFEDWTQVDKRIRNQNLAFNESSADAPRQT